MNDVESKDWGWTWLTGDRLVVRGPCYLRKAKLTPDGSNAANATLYDGIDTRGDVIIVLRCGATGNDNVNWSVPVFLKQGLYADLSTNITGLHVQYKKA